MKLLQKICETAPKKFLVTIFGHNFLQHTRGDGRGQALVIHRMSGTGRLVDETCVLLLTLKSLAWKMPLLNGHVVTVKRGTKQITNICFSDKALTSKIQDLRSSKAMIQQFKGSPMFEALASKIPDFLTDEGVNLKVEIAIEDQQDDLYDRNRKIFDDKVLSPVRLTLRQFERLLQHKELLGQVSDAFSNEAGADLCTLVAAVHLITHPEDDLRFARLCINNVDNPDETHQEFPAVLGARCQYVTA